MRRELDDWLPVTLTYVVIVLVVAVTVVLPFFV